MEHKPAVELPGVELRTLAAPSEVLIPMTSDGQQREGFYRRLSVTETEYEGGFSGPYLPEPPRRFCTPKLALAFASAGCLGLGAVGLGTGAFPITAIYLLSAGALSGAASCMLPRQQPNSNVPY